MSWIHKLYETYEKCVGFSSFSTGETPLLPIGHTLKQAHIEVCIDSSGNFLRARVIKKETIIPATEKSSTRTTNDAPHPLCEKIQYCAKDYPAFGGKKESYYVSYSKLLEAWCNSNYSHPKGRAVFQYIKMGTVTNDLIRAGILHVDSNGKLLTVWESDDAKPEIFKHLSVKKVKKGKQDQKVQDQGDGFIRWVVETAGEPLCESWKDKSLFDAWTNYNASESVGENLCMVMGVNKALAIKHPSRIRHPKDGAKLISSNDLNGYTFRGRFLDASQAAGISFEVSQKAHSALRWLISRQGYRNGDQSIVAWAISGKPIPDPFADPLGILGDAELVIEDGTPAYTAQNLGNKLKKRIAGYNADLGSTDGVVVMGLDSATTGRMAIIFYRELTGSDFLERVNSWHDKCSWIHDYGSVKVKNEDGKKPKTKHVRFVGAPSPKDIAEASYGKKADDKIIKTTIERILPCIIDGQQIPRDLVESAVRRASKRASMEVWEWNKTLSIACALYRKLNEKEGYDMVLDENRKTRDYLYGRLLAAADCLENFALFVSEKKRDTNAARWMQRFSDRPCSTWKTIELSLIPYKARLGDGRTKKYKDVIDKVHSMFDPPEDYISDKKLSGEFLLGYHCQREDLKPKKDEPKSIDDGNSRGE